MVQLHLKEPSALKTALRSFEVLKDPVYANKQLGLSGQLEVMACDCHQHAPDGPMCAADSNCINRLTYMECIGEHCGCDLRCANRRFQNHEHAKIDVFRAGKKGFGVRTMQDMPKGTFIAEYTGEVLDDTRFQRRQKKYDEQGVQHFYFMMLQKDEFIDATEKGSIARFCNHSCNPNAAIEKWVVGPRLRMGLFAKRDIARGEEICFDYKVDRYGATAQPCYCGEPNCSGFLGGRTQTGGMLLPPSVVEGLGLDSDSALSWPERAEQLLLELEIPNADREGVLKTLDQKKRSKTAALLALLDAPPSSIADETKNDSDASLRAVHMALLKSFDCPPVEEGVPEFLRILFQTQDRAWLVSLMLSRVLNSASSVDSEIMRLHGYEIMGTVLNRWKDNQQIVLPGLSVLTKWPKVTRNKISSSKIESVVKSISENAEDKILELATSLLKEWSSLEMGYRIPRRQRDEAERADTADGRNSEPPVASTLSTDAKAASDPETSANEVPSKMLENKTSRSVSNRRPLPAGWEAAHTDEGRVYYFNKAQNRMTWEFPREMRDTDLEVQRRERERRDSERQEAYLRKKEAEREAQQEQIRRIIELSATVASPAANSDAATPITPAGSIVGNSVSAGDKLKSAPDASAPTHENTPLTPKKPRKPTFETVLATYVPKVVFVSEAELGRDRCKRHARDIVHILAKKEESKKTDPAEYELTAERKKKIKGFVKEYMAKVAAHHRVRSSDGGAGKSEKNGTPPAMKRVKHEQLIEHNDGDNA